jgi:hypothetical protein
MASQEDINSLRNSINAVWAGKCTPDLNSFHSFLSSLANNAAYENSWGYDYAANYTGYDLYGQANFWISGAMNCNCACDCNCNCSGNCGGSCFIAGTLVLMADGSLKPIEEVQVGEQVAGLDGINRVVDLYQPVLGNYRSMYTFTTRDLFFTAEHPFWVRTSEGENWGVHAYSEYLYEKRYTHVNPDGTYFGPTRDPYAMTEPTEHAHMRGWLTKKAVVDRSFGDDTRLYQLITDGSHSFLANGYLVSGRTRNDYPYESARWEPALALRSR